MFTWQHADDDTLLDHHTDFRLGLSESHFPDDPARIWWSVLIEIADVSIDQFEAALAEFADDLLIPVAYDPDDRREVKELQPVTIFARKPLIEVLNDGRNVFGVVSVHLGAVIPEALLDRFATPPALSPIRVDDNAVVMAVIDDGIAIGHDLFRDGPTESRIEHASIFEAAPHSGSSHASLGRSYSRHEIDALLRRCHHNGFLDEDRFYAETGQADFLAGTASPVSRRVSHGTHVMGLAAGRKAHHADAPRPIICAILPSRVVQDTTGVDLLPLLYLAFVILAKQAGRFRTRTKGPAPVVFNFSYGNTGGPHDGTGVFASLFRHVVGAGSEFAARGQKAWLTLPAGNSNLSQLHASGPGPGKQTNVDLIAQPDDRTPSHMQIWLPVSEEREQPDFARIGITAPGGERKTISTRPGQRASLFNSRGQEVARLAYQYVGGFVQRGRVGLTIGPTAGLDEKAVLAPAGAWQLEIERSAGAPAGDIDLWVRRDETLPGSLPGGRQAYFDAADYVRFDEFGVPLAVDPTGSDCPITRSGTLNGFACGADPVVVAGYSAREAGVAGYSGAGPTSDRGGSPGREGPDLAAKSDESYLMRGVISAGSRSGSWARLSGTSVAAPRVARAAAKGIQGKADTARDWSRMAVGESPFPLNADPRRAGAGGLRVEIRFDDAQK
ncbi:S8 family serine peptidase [Jannaschia marina]|uniref:S8 family serine peptidase n=1 Tax=Jannaschia marina TaxID=2741674 RepID=UPI0015CA5DC4|nr:S8 family serine peptidase [Jannaschia marina]